MGEQSKLPQQVLPARRRVRVEVWRASGVRSMLSTMPVGSSDCRTLIRIWSIVRVEFGAELRDTVRVYHSHKLTLLAA